MTTGNRKLFILDAYALIYRAYYAFIKNPRINAKGLNTSAAFGFTTALWDVIQNQNPTHIIVAFDTPEKTKRAEIFPEYKATREKMPEDIASSIGHIRNVISAFNIPIVEYAGFEADDVIGTLAKQAEKQGFTIYIMSPDKDLGQLITPNIHLFRPAKGGNPPEIWGEREVCDKFGITHPLQLTDILGLQGDAVDNIPGVPGVGEKTAKKLIAQYGSMEKLLENTGSLKGKLKENLESYRGQALLSKQLATIETEVPVEFSPDECKLRDFDRGNLDGIFRELEFRQLASRILKSNPVAKKQAIRQGQTDLFSEVESEPDEAQEQFSNIHSTAHTYHTVQSAEQRSQLINDLLKQHCFSFDTETTDINPNIAGLVGISFSWKRGEGWYISVPDDEAVAKEILSDLNKVFLSDALKVGQNIKYDLLVLYRYGIKPKPPFFDTMVAHYLIEPSAMRRNLQALSQNHLKYDPVSYADMLEGKSDIREVPIERIKEYACEDADITLQLKEVLEPKLTESGNATLFKQIEAPLIPVLAAMEAEGIRIDREVLATQSGELSTEADQVQKRIFEDVGFEFNISSPKQVGEVLFEHLKIIDKPRKTRTGQYATGEDILLRLKHSHPVVEYILEYREILKLKNTYVDTFPSMINPHTGRIHTSFNQVVTSTGRLSSDKPNLQNIPIRSERGRRIRKAFMPRNDDYCLMSADYSQIELRVIASISKDEGMMTAFNEGLDIHAATAAKIFSVPLEDVTAEMRRKAKAVNFGIAYGQTAFGLSQSLQIPKSEAAEIIDSFFRQFPGVKLYMESVVSSAREKGFVQTLKGRKHYLKDINSLNANVRNHAERIAINSPIQGSAADMIKIAMIGIYDELNKRKLFSNLLLQVHDELVLDVHNTEIEEVKELVNQCMKTALPLEVPVIADINTGNNWLDAH